MKKIFAIEGLDRLGKSTLIKNIQHKLGFYQVIHFSKPVVLDCKIALYKNLGGDTLENRREALAMYQSESFCNSFVLTKSCANIIFDRWHLGEAVYAKRYRGYDGDYVFCLEHIGDLDKVRLILLTENFDVSNHFISDGESFDDSKRLEEQEDFKRAFNMSRIKDKRIICVTDPLTGLFRSEKDILAEALAD
jgi:thymidylate kinase